MTVFEVDGGPGWRSPRSRSISRPACAKHCSTGPTGGTGSATTSASVCGCGANGSPRWSRRGDPEAVRGTWSRLQAGAWLWLMGERQWLAQSVTGLAGRVVRRMPAPPGLVNRRVSLGPSPAPPAGPARQAARMEKLIYLLWGGRAPEAGDALRDRLLGEAGPHLSGRGARGHSGSTSTTRKPPAPPPRRHRPRARRPTWPRCRCGSTATSGGTGWTPPRLELGLPFAGYLVVESLYEDYGTTPHAGPADWPDGQRSPGRPDGGPHPPPGRSRLSRVDPALARNPVAGLGRAAAAYPLRPQRGGAAADRRGAGDRRHRRGGLAVGRTRGRPDAVLQRRRPRSSTPTSARMIESVTPVSTSTRLRSSTMSEYLTATLR